MESHVTPIARFAALALGTLLLIVGLPTAARGQTPPDRGQLIVTVADPSGGVIPGATVTLVGLDAATRAATLQPAKTSDKGVATFANLVPGRYAVRAEFAGFEAGVLDAVVVRRGDTRERVALAIKKLAESATVGPDPAAVDPRGGYTLTRAEINALSDNPREMAQQLMNMAGTNVIHIDGFVGGALPPKSQIKLIHIARDAFSAENHLAGGRVDVYTRVGDGPLTAGASYRFNRDTAMTASGNVDLTARDKNTGEARSITGGVTSGVNQPARSPFAPTTAVGQVQFVQGNLGATLVDNKSAVSLFFDRDRSYYMPLLNAALPGTRRSEVLALHQPSDWADVSAAFGYALTPNQTLRFTYAYYTERDGDGAGGFDLPERAYINAFTDHSIRAQQNGPLGRRGFMNTRFEVRWGTDADRPATEAPAMRVLHAFTSGGAQTSGGERSRGITLASDVDYVRGKHSVRTGVTIDADHDRSSRSEDDLGTYTFESLAAYQAGQPRSVVRTIGNPTVEYSDVRVGAYVQDDIRLRKNFVLSPGVRYEAQAHVPDRTNWAPRFGLNWASSGEPGQAGGRGGGAGQARTTFRFSWGLFYDWLGVLDYERTLRFDGAHQQELNIANPGSLGPVTGGPSNRYRLGADLQMPRTTRVVTALTRTISPKVRVNVNYTYQDQSGLHRGRNLNAPGESGVRPDPALANVIEVVSDASARQQVFGASVNLNPTVAGGRGGGAGPGAGPRLFNWRRTSVTLGYTYNSRENNTEGTFAVPPGGNLATEWGPATSSDFTDIRHSVSMQVNSTAVRNLTAVFTVFATTGPAYTTLTGQDVNGDLIFNDRPAGVGRNTARGARRMNVGANLRYTFTAGGGAQGAHEYQVTLVARVANLLNRPNYGGYSGVMTSPFFGAPTHVLTGGMGPRTISFGVTIGF
jgi:hypothetical protein